MKRSLPPLLAAVLAWGLVTGAATAQPPDADPDDKPKQDPNEAALVAGNTDFALSLYRQLASKDGNVFFSPYSLSRALAMTYAGAKGKTAEEMKTALHFDLEPAALHDAFGKLDKVLLLGRHKHKLLIANNVWAQQKFGFDPNFTKLLKDKYDSELTELDFKQKPEEAREHINNTVKEVTQQKIEELLPKGIITNDTRLVLTNAIYFKAAWKIPFKQEETKPGTFTMLDGKTVKVPMMFAERRAKLHEEKDMVMLALPYDGGELTMFVVLPREEKGLPEVEKRLTGEGLKKRLAKVPE